MSRLEHIPLNQPSTYFLYGLFGEEHLARRKRLLAWRTTYHAFSLQDSQHADIMLADAVSRTIEERNRLGRKKSLTDFIVFVAHQGVGKDYIADHMYRNGYARITMSDIVRSVAPVLGYSPDSTQGKIDAGHVMRRMFGKGIFVDLGVREAMERGKKRIVMTGPRSSLEIRTAKKYGARIVGLIADIDPKTDWAIRLERATRPRKQKGSAVRVMTKQDFISRERQEKRRINRLMAFAEIIVVNNRPARKVISELI